MGMAYHVEKKVIAPRYKGTVVCQNCETEYSPSLNWANVRHHPGTTGGRDVINRIPENVCPVCKTLRVD